MVVGICYCSYNCGDCGCGWLCRNCLFYTQGNELRYSRLLYYSAV